MDLQSAEVRKIKREERIDPFAAVSADGGRKWKDPNKTTAYKLSASFHIQ
jgi:hypothetical protein